MANDDTHNASFLKGVTNTLTAGNDAVKARMADHVERAKKKMEENIKDAQNIQK
jgi:hypothetical protein